MELIRIFRVKNLIQRVSAVRLSNLFVDHAKRGAFYYADGLTGLRGFAAFWVFLYHVWVTSTPRPMLIEAGSYCLDFTPFFSGGWSGVDIFYVLSAFLLTLPFARAAVEDGAKPGLWRYFRRRILRIFPAYYAQLAILLCLAWIEIYGEFPDMDNLFLHLFMAHNLSFQYNQAINMIWWTLPVEFSFYLVLPLLAVLLRKSRWPILVGGAIGLTILYRYWTFQLISAQSVPYKVWAMEQFPGHLDQFVFGMMAAYFFVRKSGVKSSGLRSESRVAASVPFVLGIVGIVSFLYLGHFNFQKYWEGHLLLFIWHGCVGLFIALVIYGVASNCPLGRFLLGNRPIILLGVVSYSLYLWHLPVIDWLMRWDFLAHYQGYVLPILLIAALSISLGIAVVSYLIFERPFLMWRAGKT